MSKKLYLKEYDGSIRLGAAHSLITGHGPRLAIMEKEAIERKKEIANLGLFEYSSPNFNTYYPEATESDLKPNEAEFIRPVYRALSEVVVRKNIDPLDFSKDNVLKASMSLLEAQTVYTNHDAFIGNEIGVVSKVFWDEGHTSNGIKIPAGINAEFLIDGKAHPNLARKILMDPPAVHSNSVTVTFKWTPSHPKMDISEFRGKVGTYDDKGQLIRRIVTEITAFYETSLVSHGADPFAKQIRDGKIVSPEFSKARDSFSEQIPESKQYFMFSYKDSLSEITIPKILNNNETGTEDENKTQQKMKKETIILLAALLGFEISAEQLAMTEEEFQEAFDMESFEAEIAKSQPDLLAQAGTIETLTAEKETAEAEVERLTAENATLSSSSDEITQMKADLLADVKRLYETTSGKKATDALSATFQKSDYAVLKSYKELYEAQLEEKYPNKCGNCGSTQLSRGSANEEGEEEQQIESLSAREIRSFFRNGEIELDPNRDY